MKNFISKHATQAAYTAAESTFDKPHVAYIEELAGLANCIRYMEKPPHNYSQDYLTIVSLEDNNTIRWKTNNKLLKTISISTDNGTTWTEYTSSTSGATLGTLNTGDKLLIKGSNTTYETISYYNYFVSTGNFNVEGNIMSLLYEDNFANQTTLDSNGYNFGGLFANCTKLISAKNLILPATALADWCYRMMFYNCSSLTFAPELPATTLATSCYSIMFSGCTSLTTAPELPATTLAEGCYGNMFRDCTSLNYIKCLATDISANECTDDWVQNVAASGIFVKDASADWSSKTGDTGIPSGWILMTTNDLPILLWEKLSYTIPINSFQKPKLLNPTNVPVTYSSSDTTIAIIDANGIITYVDEGTVTLTASFSGNNDYHAKTATCTLTITEYDTYYDYLASYLTITSLTDNNTIGWKTVNNKLLKTISISTDNGTTWTEYTSSTSGATLGTLNNGDKLLIKGSNTVYGNNYYYNYFTSTGNFNVSGNVMSLIYGDNFINQTILDSAGYNLKNLFNNCTKLISAENLILPATTLATYCYYYMFQNCTSLTTAPELPATTLAQYCYICMFQGCTALTSAPELPATTLADWCYASMFRECTTLTTAPELPSTTLATNCYYQMFHSCTSLTTAPELPATTLANQCYGTMFYGCTSLNYIKCLATDISASNCTTSWVSGVGASGTFIKAASADWSSKTGTSGIPSGWTVQDGA